MAYGLFRSLLPCSWFEFWPGYIRCLSMPVSLPFFQTTKRLIISFSYTRISTQILSHFVEDFTLVSAFILFVLGCINIALGIIFRESAKVKRSINLSPWCTKVKDILPVSQDVRLVFINNNSGSTVFSSPGEKASSIEAPRRRDRTSSRWLWQ